MVPRLCWPAGARRALRPGKTMPSPVAGPGTCPAPQLGAILHPARGTWLGWDCSPAVPQFLHLWGGPGLCAVLGLPSPASTTGLGNVGVPDLLPRRVSPSPAALETPEDDGWPSPPGHFQLSWPRHWVHPRRLRRVRLCPGHSQFFPKNFLQIHAAAAETSCRGMVADGQRTDPGTRLHPVPLPRSHSLSGRGWGFATSVLCPRRVPTTSPPRWRAHGDVYARVLDEHH